ncbi:hypothetical protein BBI17_009310 [Phytophthora kernoviae]|uniref:SCP domain-containing protein n=2 Tax=Phytophthora kernoviae TaxID=325452 RepID=A0A3R7GQA1_9STRA|nr:hypothetical protein JM16_009165 [Phytophthora kernoviae]RLN27218.1 hypothetical protein BBI17_009310 [Phytophthora kernoviae]
MVIPKSSLALLLLIATASNNFVDAANLRQERNLEETYSQSGDYLPAMLARVNKERAAHGLSPLCANKKLQASSQRHSDDEAAKNYMAHDGSDGSTMSQRITEAGYNWSAVAENVAAGQVDVEAVMDAWMDSPGHRENILGDYTMLGASYAYNDNTEYKHYWTQDFGASDNEKCDDDTSAGSNNNDQPGDDDTSAESNNYDQLDDSNNQKQDQAAQNEDRVQSSPATEAPVESKGSGTANPPTLTYPFANLGWICSTDIVTVSISPTPNCRHCKRKLH